MGWRASGGWGVRCRDLEAEWTLDTKSVQRLDFTGYVWWYCSLGVDSVRQSAMSSQGRTPQRHDAARGSGVRAPGREPIAA